MNRRRMIRRTAVALLCALAPAFQSLAQTQPAAPAKLSREQIVEDFRVARRALEEGHSGIYRYTKKADLDRIFDAAERSIDRPMDAWELYRILAPAVAAVKCGHTAVALPDALQEKLNTSVPLLPLQVKVLGGKPYVFRDFSSPAGSLAGLEIRSVNGVPASRIVATMMAAAPGDGDVVTSRERRISDWRFAGNLVRFMDMKSPYEVTLWNPGAKETVRQTLAGVELPKLLDASKARYPQDQRIEDSGDLELLDDGRIARITVRGFFGFADAEKKEDLSQFFKASFEAMRAKGTKVLVLDVRGNGGGEDALGRILLSYLLDAPFKYYDDLVLNKISYDFKKYVPEWQDIPEKLVEKRADGLYHAVGHPNWGLQQPGAPGFGGRVIVLIDGDSFSTTSEFLSQVHFHRRATFVGEESGGGYYGNTSGLVPAVTLPNTKLAVHVPLLTYYVAVSGYGPAAHGVVPDYPVHPAIADLIAGKDPALEKALALARAAQ
jgi:peptidase S41-like protein